jgi:poly(A) polymerase/tRNA nucleotidyltransferase (CCA-adding enzyme)
LARYGKGAPDEAAVAAIADMRDGILGLSAERIWSELKNILRAEDPVAAVALMRETGVLSLVIPEGAKLERLNLRAPATPLLRVAALLTGDPAAFAARLKISNDEAETLHAYLQPNTLTPAADDADLRRALAETAPDVLVAHTWLAQTDDGDWDGLRARMAAMRRPVFPLHGRDITALGIPPGPRIGEILDAVRAWWLDGGCTADATACRAKMAAIIGAG